MKKISVVGGLVAGVCLAAAAGFLPPAQAEPTDQQLAKHGKAAPAHTATGPKDSAALSADLPYQAALSNQTTCEVDFSAVVTPPYGCKVLKVWMPLPPSDQAQQIRNARLSTFPMRVKPQIATESVYGNRFAYFEFHEPKGAQIIRHRFQATVSNLNWNVDLAKVTDVADWPESFKPYLQSPQLEQQRELEKTLAEITQQPKRGPGVLVAAMRWVNDNLEYDHDQASLRADPDHALAFRRGHCSDYHGLCATLGRSLGFPTRVTYGLSLFPKNSPSHCKLEAFLPPYGWVSFDLSETQKLVEKIQAAGNLSDTEKKTLAEAAWQRLQRGYRENSWLLVTRGTNYELAPKASRPVAVVRTIYAEADGEPLPEPDPANRQQREFGWMTVHHYVAEQPLQHYGDLEPLRRAAR